MTLMVGICAQIKVCQLRYCSTLKSITFLSISSKLPAAEAQKKSPSTELSF